jgi:hypothetical protein
MSHDDEDQITSPGWGRLGAGNGRASIGECRGRGIGRAASAAEAETSAAEKLIEAKPIKRRRVRPIKRHCWRLFGRVRPCAIIALRV